MSNRDAIQYVPNAIYDSNGDILASQFRNNGVVKFNADGSRNREFNDNVGRYTGNASDSCQISSTGMGYGGAITKNTVARHTADIRFAEELTTDNGALTNTDIFFFRSNDRQLRDDQAIVGYSENGQDCLMYLELGITIMGLDYQQIGDEHFLFVTGRVGNSSAFVSFNLNTGMSSGVQTFTGNLNNSFARLGRLTWRIAVNSDASMLYLGRVHIYGYTMERNGDTYRITNNAASRLYARVNRGNLDTQLADVLGIDVSPDDDDILYITSARRHVIQKVQLDTNTTYTILARAGTGRRNNGKNIDACSHNYPLVKKKTFKESASNMGNSAGRFTFRYGIYRPNVGLWLNRSNKNKPEKIKFFVDPDGGEKVITYPFKLNWEVQIPTATLYYDEIRVGKNKDEVDVNLNSIPVD